MSLSYAQSPLIMVVPPGIEFSSFAKLLIAFEEPVWYVIYTMMLVVIVITTLVKCQPSRVQNFVFGKHNRTPFLNIFTIIVGLPMHRPPGRNFSRWLNMMFVLMWLIIRSLYQAVLYKNLQSTERNLPVQSVEETLRLGFTYYMISPTQDNIKYLPELYNRRIVLPRNESFEIMLRFNDPTLKAAFLGAFDTVRYSNKVKLYGFALNVCREPLLIRQYGIVFPKGSFLVPSIDEKLTLLMDNGLINYWLSEHTDTAKEQLPVREPLKLTLNHLLSAFQVLYSGVVLAFIAFAVELLSVRVELLTKLFRFCE